MISCSLKDSSALLLASKSYRARQYLDTWNVKTSPFPPHRICLGRLGRWGGDWGKVRATPSGMGSRGWKSIEVEE